MSHGQLYLLYGWKKSKVLVCHLWIKLKRIINFAGKLEHVIRTLTGSLYKERLHNNKNVVLQLCNSINLISVNQPYSSLPLQVFNSLSINLY